MNGFGAMTRCRAAAVLIVVTVSGCTSAPTAQAPPLSQAAKPAPDAGLTTTALTVTAVHPPVRIFGSDGKTHLDYDLVFQSVFNAPVTLTSIEVLDGGGTSLLRMAGELITAASTSLFPGAPTAVVPAGGSLGTVVDVVLPSATVPDRLRHRITYQLGDSEFASVIGTSDVDGPELEVSSAVPTTIAPPVRGADWLNTNSCCAPRSPHRQTRVAVGGVSIATPETFAVDWVQTRAGKLFDGDGGRVEDWPAYGKDLFAVADGVVAAVVDDYPNQTPLQAASGLRGPDDYSGNHVSIEIAPGIWAIYAHAQPGSITVQPGDRVTEGQVIGKLGNSGNTSGPHLHFQLADGPEIMTSNSLPFSLDSYRLAGSIDGRLLTEPSDAPGGGSPILNVSGPAGPQTDTYPLTFSVTDFAR